MIALLSNFLQARTDKLAKKETRNKLFFSIKVVTVLIWLRQSMTFIFRVHSLLCRLDALRHSRSSPSDKPPVLTLADLTPGGISFTKNNSSTSHQRRGIHMSSTYPESTDLFDKKVYYHWEQLNLV